MKKLVFLGKLLGALFLVLVIIAVSCFVYTQIRYLQTPGLDLAIAQANARATVAENTTMEARKALYAAAPQEFTAHEQAITELTNARSAKWGEPLDKKSQYLIVVFFATTIPACLVLLIIILRIPAQKASQSQLKKATS